MAVSPRRPVFSRGIAAWRATMESMEAVHRSDAGRDHDHAHDHDRGGRAHFHDHRDAPARKLAITLAMTASFCCVEAAAGWIFGSLALLADAGHMLSDAAALLL